MIATPGAPEVPGPAAATVSAHVVFSVSGRPCALPVSAVGEVLPAAELARPPGLPPILAGFLDLGGTAVAVIRTARLFELPEPDLDRAASLLLMRRARVPTALLVDAVHAVVPVAAEAWSPVAPEASLGGCVIGEADAVGRRVALLADDRLLFREEAARLAELAAAEQRRLEAVRTVP
jgi:purine-binding chemotaxis protein CheW